MLAKYIPTEANRKTFIIAATERLAASTPGPADGPTVRFSRNLIDAADLEVAFETTCALFGTDREGHREEDAGKADRPAAYYRQLAQNIPEACGPRPFSQGCRVREVGPRGLRLERGHQLERVAALDRPQLLARKSGTRRARRSPRRRRGTESRCPNSTCDGVTIFISAPSAPSDSPGRCRSGIS